MMKGSLTLTLPNPHEGEISQDLLADDTDRMIQLLGYEWILEQYGRVS